MFRTTKFFPVYTVFATDTEAHLLKNYRTHKFYESGVPIFN